MNRKSEIGFILIELVTTLVLIGVIGAFAGLFLYNGINGFLVSKRNSEIALKTQITMDRISAELRDIKSSPAPTFTSKSISYESKTLPDPRVLQFETVENVPGIYLSVNNVKNILLDGVDIANSGITPIATNNLDHSADNSKEISAIKVNFRLIEPNLNFEVSIYPRSLITVP